MAEDVTRREIIDMTLEVWAPRASRELSREDAREILENVTGFFGCLLRWDVAERQTCGAAAGSTSKGSVPDDDGPEGG